MANLCVICWEVWWRASNLSQAVVALKREDRGRKLMSRRRPFASIKSTILTCVCALYTLGFCGEMWLTSVDFCPSGSWWGCSSSRHTCFTVFKWGVIVMSVWQRQQRLPVGVLLNYTIFVWPFRSYQRVLRERSLSFGQSAHSLLQSPCYVSLLPGL